MDRRDFFRRGAQKAARAVVESAEIRARHRAARWIRPPFALDELDFLLACTRCGECTTACPHEIIFALPARLGAQVVGTPAMDLVNKGCRLCPDWPCAAACEPAALRRPGSEVESTPLPRMADVRVDADRCLPYLGPECGVCASSCPVPGAMSWEGHTPRIDPEACTGCALCREACILEPKAIVVRSVHQAASIRNEDIPAEL